MQIAEIFESIQGEGPWAGTPSLFIRTSGCNLRCSFCGTPYTSWKPEGNAWTVDDLVHKVAASNSPDVVLTGGEPLLVPELPELAQRCQSLGKRVTVETAGTVHSSTRCDLFAISPKLANSTPDDPRWNERHQTTRFQPAVVQTLIQQSPSILKFVIDQPDDIHEILTWVRLLPMLPPSAVWLMPQARTREQLRDKSQWVRQLALAHSFNFSPRLHLEMFGDVRGT
ncbi:MAG: 7-carboxy-7-deazaguanine synthase QueE [Planctomyces sp.]